MDSKQIAKLASIAENLEKDSFEQLVAYAAIGKIIASSYIVRNSKNGSSRALEFLFSENQRTQP